MYTLIRGCYSRARAVAFLTGLCCHDSGNKDLLKVLAMLLNIQHYAEATVTAPHARRLGHPARSSRTQM